MSGLGFQKRAWAANFVLGEREEFFRRKKTNECEVEKYSLESFERLQVVGEGTYGKVYKAKLLENLAPQYGIYRALKLLKLDEEREGWPITSLREIILLKKLCHKNIVKLLDVFVHKKNNSSKLSSVITTMKSTAKSKTQLKAGESSWR